MQLTVLDHYNNQKQVLEGPESEVRLRLFELYPWLLGLDWNVSIPDLVKELDRSQRYSALISSVELEKSEDDGFWNYQAEEADLLVEAAEFLSGVKVDPVKHRAALLANDGDKRVALLVCTGLAVTKENLEALEAVLGNLGKSESNDPVEFKEILAVNESGTEFAEAIKRASNNGKIKRVNLGSGKHSQSTLLAWDSKTFQNILLKPGSGKQNPAIGEDSNNLTQSCREAAFFAVAQAWGLGQYVPECYLLKLDGKEYAAISFLASQWTNGNKLKKENSGLARRVLSTYLGNGDLFKWAVLDYVLGNPDRHSGNIMFRQGEIRLIDHGSALANLGFHPAKDEYSFVPYYIRALCPGNFNELSPIERLRTAPRLYVLINKQLDQWIQSLDKETLSKILMLHGVDPIPFLARLEALQESARIMSPDVAVLSAWLIG